MKSRDFRCAALGLLLALGAGAATALASPPPTFRLTIHDHHFQPQTLSVPPGKRIRLKVHNARRMPSEFESFSLNREKVVPGGSTIEVWIGPLSPGKYKFFDDFNTGVSGHIIVKAKTSGKAGAR